MYHFVSEGSTAKAASIFPIAFFFSARAVLIVSTAFCLMGAVKFSSPLQMFTSFTIVLILRHKTPPQLGREVEFSHGNIEHTNK